MKKLNFVLAKLAVVLVFGVFAMMFVGCKTDSEPTYTVWAASMSYSEWSATYAGGATLDNNIYTRAEITNSEWDMYKTSLPDSWKHDWTEDQIYIWFLESTFGEALSKQLTTWLITVDHGVLALRRGSVVYGIAK